MNPSVRKRQSKEVITAGYRPLPNSNFGERGVSPLPKKGGFSHDAGEELKARGLVAQITDEEIIDLISNGKATFYIGFDCTTDSLTAGHFLALSPDEAPAVASNKPIARSVAAR